MLLKVWEGAVRTFKPPSFLTSVPVIPPTLCFLSSSVSLWLIWIPAAVSNQHGSKDEICVSNCCPAKAQHSKLSYILDLTFWNLFYYTQYCHKIVFFQWKQRVNVWISLKIIGRYKYKWPLLFLKLLPNIKPLQAVFSAFTTLTYTKAWKRWTLHMKKLRQG